MASSFLQPRGKLPPELFPPPASREGFWKNRGVVGGCVQPAAFRSNQAGFAPASPFPWKRRSAWSPFPPPLPLALPPAQSFGPKVWALAGWRSKLTGLGGRWVQNSEQTPESARAMLKWDQKQRMTSALSIQLLCPKLLGDTKYTGSKQHNTPLPWIPAAGSLHTLSEGALKPGGLTLPGSCEFPQSRRICTWVRTDLVFKLPIYHDNEGSGAGQRGCCPDTAESPGGFGGQKQVRCPRGRKGIEPHGRTVVLFW